MNLFRFAVACFVAVAVSMVGLNAAHAQNFAPAAPISVSNLIYEGSETVTGAPSILSFGFKTDGQAFMVDAATKPNDPKTIIQGNWTQNGNQVEIRFSNCVYVGQLNGTVLSGNASMFNNPNNPWYFQVTFAPGK